MHGWSIGDWRARLTLVAFINHIVARQSRLQAAIVDPAMGNRRSATGN